MPNLSSMLPILLSITLFFITLIIIFILRANDKKGRNIGNIKKLIERALRNIEDSDNNFKQYASELEQTVAKKDLEVKELIQTVNGQLGELKSYSEDLARLRNCMDTYREALEGLARLTKDADDKIQNVHDEVDRLDKVRSVIDGFRQDMKDADEHLRKHEQRVIQLERESIGRMNEAVSETDSSMDEAMAGLHRESQEVFDDFKARTDKDTELRLRKIDEAFQAVIHTVQEFFAELESKMEKAREVSDRLGSMTQEFPKADAHQYHENVIEETKVQEPKYEEPKYEEPAVEEVEVEPTVDYMEMTFSEPVEPSQEEEHESWETYGEEEVITFDEDEQN